MTLTLDDVVLDNVALILNSDGTTPSIQIDAGDTLTWAGASSFGPGSEGGAASSITTVTLSIPAPLSSASR